MVLFTNGYKKYFDPHLLKLMKDDTEEAINILERFLRSEDLRELRELKDSSHSTLLHYAAEYGNADVAKYLLDSKCEIDAQDDLGISPLMLAVTGENEEVFKVLLEADANIHLTDRQRNSALQIIFKLKSKRTEMLKVLFQNVSWDKIIEGIAAEDLRKKLIDELGYKSRDILYWGNSELMRYLCSRDFAIVARRYDGAKTLLHLAIQNNLPKVAKTLIECGAQVDAVDSQRATALHYLYDHDKYGNVSENETDETLEMLRLLMSRATTLTSRIHTGHMQLSMALKFGSEGVVEIVLQSNVNLNVRDGWGNTLIHYLARNRRVNLFKLLRNRKFNVNARNKYGYTPLHFAAFQNFFDAVRFFVEKGADVDAVINSGATPLFRAFFRKDTWDERAIELLLQHGANPQIYVEEFGVLKTMFDYIISRARYLQPDVDLKKHMSIAQPLIARLAILKELGTEVTELTRLGIEQRTSWVKYFEECQRQVKKMKEITFYHRQTLFEFLNESQEKLTAYARNEELVAELERRINEEFDEKSPYPGLIRRRMAKATELAELKDKAVRGVCWIFGKKDNSIFFAAVCVVEYLSVEDMENLCDAVGTIL